MSHFSTIKTELRNLIAVKAALRRLGVSFEEGGKIEDYYHAIQRVDLIAHIPGQRPVGFMKDVGTGVINLIGDWYGGGVSRDDFLSKLKCNYAREQVLASLEQQGVDVSRIKEREEPDGSVVFELPLDDGQMEALVGG